MVIIGGWQVALSAIIAYQYREQELGMKPFIDALLVSGDTISGYADMDTVNKILQHMLKRAAGPAGEE